MLQALGLVTGPVVSPRLDSVSQPQPPYNRLVTETGNEPPPRRLSSLRDYGPSDHAFRQPSDLCCLCYLPWLAEAPSRRRLFKTPNGYANSFRLPFGQWSCGLSWSPDPVSAPSSVFFLRKSLPINLSQILTPYHGAIPQIPSSPFVL